MTFVEFKQLKVGDICKVIRGKDAGMKCVVLHKEESSFIKDQTPISMVVLAKPLNEFECFDSATVSYRYFKLFSHTELKIL